MRVLHILSAREWVAAVACGWHAPPSLAAQGFVHCCTEAQLPFVAARFFAGQSGLLVIGLEPERTGAAVRWEVSEPDQPPFPHLYGRIPVAAVVSVRRLDGLV